MIDGEQLSLFDIQLPPNTIEETQRVVADLKPNISPARVSEDEYRYNDKVKVPTVDDILKTLENGAYSVSRYTLLSDVFELGAIAVSNAFHFQQKREDRYLQIIKKYDAKMKQVIMKLFSQIYVLLQHQINPRVGFNDYLGELYMRSETSNSKAGQFFTPYCISRVCAEMSIDEAKVNKFIESDEIITMNEPACGAGGMVLAAADTLYNKYKFNISRNLFVECSDIDSRCVHMTYLQLGLAGIPAVIYKRDTLTLQTWERWETPAYLMQYTRFKDF